MIPATPANSASNWEKIPVGSGGVNTTGRNRKTVWEKFPVDGGKNPTEKIESGEFEWRRAWGYF